MLQYIKKLYGDPLNASDGLIGKIMDFYFDDQSWKIRYLAADTGTWLNERQVLISPYSIDRFDRGDDTIVVNLTRQQIVDSPSIDRHKPVSRQFEIKYYTYYGWPYYWRGDSILGLGGIPMTYTDAAAVDVAKQEQHLRDDIHLRSTLALDGYEIEGNDGTLGRVINFLVDDQTWAIEELVVEAGHWYSGKEILLPVDKIQSISFNESKIHARLTREDVELTDDHHVAHAHHH